MSLLSLDSNWGLVIKDVFLVAKLINAMAYVIANVMGMYLEYHGQYQGPCQRNVTADVSAGVGAASCGSQSNLV